MALLLGIAFALPGLAKAAPTCGQKQILIVYADYVPPAHLTNALLPEQGVASVTGFDATTATPTLANLEPYNLVLTFSWKPYADADALGNVLADYQDLGHGLVVPLTRSFYGPDSPHGLNGRWSSGNYSPFTYATTGFYVDELGAADFAHPLMNGVTGLLAGYPRLGVGIAQGATQVAAYRDGWPLIAYKGNVVAVNAYLGESNIWVGQFSRVIVNAFDWLCRGGPPPHPPPPPPPPPGPPPSTRCDVPKVVGLRLRAATRKIRRRQCRVGHVRRAHSSRVGRVLSQQPRPGSVRPKHFPVALVVGRR